MKTFLKDQQLWAAISQELVNVGLIKLDWKSPMHKTFRADFTTDVEPDARGRHGRPSAWGYQLLGSAESDRSYR